MRTIRIIIRNAVAVKPARAGLPEGLCRDAGDERRSLYNQALIDREE
jgi:hypothetical protein